MLESFDRMYKDCKNLSESNEMNSDYTKDQVKRRNNLFNKLCKDLSLTKAIYLSSGRGLTNRNNGDIGAIYSKSYDILDILSDNPSVLDAVEKYLANNYPEIHFKREFDDTIVIQGSELLKLMLESFDKLFDKKILKEESNSEKLKKAFSDLNLKSNSNASKLTSNSNRKFDIGDNVYIEISDDPSNSIKRVSQKQKIVYKTDDDKNYQLEDCDIWIDKDSLLTDADIQNLEAQGYSISIVQTERTVAPFWEPKNKAKESVGLNTVTIKGIEIPIIEHFKDIKKYCENEKLFRRWYNRDQFLKAILNTSGDFDDYWGFGNPIGTLDGEDSNEVWAIDIYDTDTMTKEQLENALDETGAYDSGFFLKAKTGKIYFVFTDVD